MKVTINKEYVSAANMNAARAAAKAFKAEYTDMDLARAYAEQVSGKEYFYLAPFSNVLRANVETIDGSNYGPFEPCFHVEVVIESPASFDKIRFFCDAALNVDQHDSLLLTHEHYSCAR